MNTTLPEQLKNAIDKSHKLTIPLTDIYMTADCPGLAQLVLCDQTSPISKMVLSCQHRNFSNKISVSSCLAQPNLPLK